MKFTFGITTNNGVLTSKIVESIRREKIPEYEIIVIGSTLVTGEDIINISFDENQKFGWITKKKNIITERAKFDNIVYMHDYICLNDSWYQGQLQAGEYFSIRMDKIINNDGSRFRDWCLWAHNDNFMDSLLGNTGLLLPYEFENLSRFMYISGSYWVAKKSVMQQFPLNEDLVWGQGEDVEWSKRVRSVYNFTMNQNSSVFILKSGKDRAFNEPNEELYKKLKMINNEY